MEFVTCIRVIDWITLDENTDRRNLRGRPNWGNFISLFLHNLNEVKVRMNEEHEIVLYQIEDTNICVNVIFKDETFWMTQKAM